MTECTFNPRMVKTIVTQCHVYDEQNNYVAFDWEKDEPFFAMQRNAFPNL